MVDMIDSNQKFTVEQARILSGHSQESMAKALGLSKNAYINKEKGLSRFYVDEAILFEKICGINFSKIKFF